MNLAEAIHQRWAADESLDNLLPASRVYTGLSADPTVPYAVITKQSHRPTAHHNDGSAVDSVGVRIEVFHGNLDSAAEIMDRLKAAMDRADFGLSGGDKVINVQRANDFQRQERDGVWRLVIDFDCSVYLA